MAIAHPEFTAGSVWLVGAGPGDPGLLTLLAAHALAEADIVLYDALVDHAIFSAFGPRARAIAVGRRKGQTVATMAETIAQMRRFAAAGQRVVRLKGGDPFIFGRGAEELSGLIAAGVPVRVVPGVTAGIGGLAYAGIAATARGINSAVTFLTAHDETGGFADGLDWAALAGHGQALVVYMGLSVLDEIVSRLLAAGRDGRTPVAIVSRAATSAQRTLVTTLGDAVLAARRARLAAPALIAIGDFAAPERIFEWFDPASLSSSTGSGVDWRGAASG